MTTKKIEINQELTETVLHLLHLNNCVTNQREKERETTTENLDLATHETEIQAVNARQKSDKL